MADSRPEPGPCTRTCTRRTPSDIASRAACSAATVAANGVDFLEPLKPALPEDPHDTVFPCVSAIVMVVLLNVALMWATPSASMTRLLFFAVAIGLLGHLLLAGDRAAWTLLCACVGMRPLTVNRQTATVPDAAIRADVHQLLDVHRHLGSQGTFDAVVTLDRLTEAIHVGIVQIANPKVRAHTGGRQDAASRRAADPEDVCQPDLDLLFTREVNASNTSHDLALSLLMLWVALANDPGHTAAFHHSAVLTDRLHAAADFHRGAPVEQMIISAKTLRLTGLRPLCKGSWYSLCRVSRFAAPRSTEPRELWSVFANTLRGDRRQLFQNALHGRRRVGCRRNRPPDDDIPRSRRRRLSRRDHAALVVGGPAAH